MSIHESSIQTRDSLTGVRSAVTSEACDAEVRAACTALNKRRARGILEVSRFTPQRQSTTIDVWTAAFIEEARLWEVPIVPMEALGLQRDEEGFLASPLLQALPSGAEAAPYLHREGRVVYKLFDLRAHGGMGKKIVLQRDADGQLQDEIKDAVLQDTVRKLSALNDGGGHPTEIVGIVDSFDHLLVKQPLAFPYEDFAQDRKVAMEQMRCVTPMGGNFRHPLSVFWAQEEPWLIGDLHKGNIMIDAEGHPTIIDALVGYLPPYVLQELRWVGIAADDARLYRETGQAPLHHSLFELVNDDEL